MKTKAQSKTDTQKKFSSEQIRELKQLKHELKDSRSDISALIKSASSKTAEALAEILLRGNQLIRVKNIIGFGGFMAWLKTELKWSDSDIRSGQNWMRQVAAHKFEQSKNESVSYQPTTDIQDVIKLQDNAFGDGTKTNPILIMKPVTLVGHKKLVDDKRLKTPTPISNHKPVTALPAMSLNDVLSRAKYLRDELTKNLITVIQSNKASIKDIESIIIVPIQKCVDGQKK